jgi:hypothetical protein
VVNAPGEAPHLGSSPGEEDLRRLVAIEEIRRLQARYMRFADMKDWAALAELFTLDGEFVTHGVDGSVMAHMRGRGEIKSAIDAAVGSAQPIHHLFSHEIDVDLPSQATAIWAMADLVISASASASAADDVLPQFETMRGYGHYHVRYVRIDGAWKIAYLTQTRLRLEFS